MTTSKPRMSFWASREVSRLISRAMTEKDPRWKRKPGVPPILDLRQRIVTSTHGKEIVPPPIAPPTGYCIDQLPFKKDKSVSSYTRFLYYLGVVADLVSLFRQKVENDHGRDAWKKASVIFDDNAERRTLFQFLREVSTADRGQAVRCLESISKGGLTIDWPGQVSSCFWAKDCGVKVLVAITEEMLDYLATHSAASGSSDARRLDAAPRIKRGAQVWLDTYATKQGSLVRLKTRGQESVDLADMGSKLITTLKREGLSASDEALCNELWPDKSTGDWERGAFGSLKNLVSQVNSKLTRDWGQPPDHKRWIGRIEKGVYFLNGSVHWDYLTNKDFSKKRRR